MHFESFSDFLNMGGYAPYVWAGVGGSLLALGAIVVVSWYQNKQVKQFIRQQQARDARIAEAKQMENTL
ncbi:heme exporter protein CcmD [Thaumasiovibrio subtropicus]|uniref:heme exporter protein CcmD n=1 Tax=Thaumasiovibrio subtropicus TaxID=1891207 RepID=UPI000B363522|nr:heme exporter protein CcmD [Thaumasiovibrio subtropicus]